MSRSFRDVKDVVPQTKVELIHALVIYSHLKTVLAMSRGLCGDHTKMCWDNDVQELLRIADELKLDKRRALIHTCADLAIQIERSLSLTSVG